MIDLNRVQKYYVACGYTDLRRGIDGLAAIVSQQFGQELREDSIACLEANSTPCARMFNCRTLPLWQGLDRVISEYLGRYTIADLMQAGQPGDDYII